MDLNCQTTGYRELADTAVELALGVEPKVKRLDLALYRSTDVDRLLHLGRRLEMNCLLHIARFITIPGTAGAEIQRSGCTSRWLQIVTSPEGLYLIYGMATAYVFGSGIIKAQPYELSNDRCPTA